MRGSPLHLILLVAGLALALPARTAAQEPATFVVRLGRDTVGVDRFTRTASRVVEDAAVRSPRAGLRHIEWDLAPDGHVTRVAVAYYDPADTGALRPIQRMVATFSGDSAVVETSRDTLVRTRRFAVRPGVLPLLPPASWAWLEIATARAARAHADSLHLDGWFIGSDTTFVAVRRRGPDSVVISDRFDTWDARVDAQGGLLGTAPRAGGTEQFALERVRAMDVAVVARAWAAREREAGAAGQLSPRDTTRARIAGATVMVDYGRPSRRGRSIFGTVVAYDRVWRTGANAATQFHTDRALAMGGVVVPAGSYTLWTIPSASGWKLLINGETGQWGTAHKPERDLFQLDLRTTTLAAPVEQFTIGITASGQGGILSLEWDTTRASIPFTVR